MKNLVLFCLGLFACCEAKKLNIDIMYSTLCPDSYNFIRRQLYPAYEEIAPYVNIKLIPFGKGKSLGDGRSFQCQHGPEECNGNLLNSCAFEALKDNQHAQVEHVNCFMSTFRDIVYEGLYNPPCLEDVGISLNFMKQCENTFGAQLQLQAEEETDAVRPRFIPTIVYNKVFNQRAQDASLKNFRRVVCKLISKTHPEACGGVF